MLACFYYALLSLDLVYPKYIPNYPKFTAHSQCIAGPNGPFG